MTWINSPKLTSCTLHFCKCPLLYVHLKRCSRLYSECWSLRSFVSAADLSSPVSASLRFRVSANSVASVRVADQLSAVRSVTYSHSCASLRPLPGASMRLLSARKAYQLCFVVFVALSALTNSAPPSRDALIAWSTWSLSFIVNTAAYILTAAVCGAACAADRDAERYLNNENWTLG